MATGTRTTFMPSQKVNQVLWAAQFVQNVAGQAPAYGIPTGMMTQFTQVNTDLQAAWAVSENVETRTRTKIRATDALLKQMRQLAGRMSAIAQATPGVTDEMLTAAGFTVRKSGRSIPPIPSVPPILDFVESRGRVATFRARANGGRTANLKGLMYYTRKQGEPSWSFALATTKATATLDFGTSPTGDTVQVCACWTNSRDQAGPACNAIDVNLPAGGLQPKPNTGEAPMRLVA